MKQITINPNNEPYYSEDFIKGFECGTQRQFEADKADRPPGEWIDMGDFEKCSVCKGTHLKEFQSCYGKVAWIKTPYCPNCGADMRSKIVGKHADFMMIDEACAKGADDDN